MMKTRPFDIQSDLPIVKHWWDDRNQTVDIESMISNRGLIVPEVCVAWLYLTDGPFAPVELPISNPDASLRDVHEGFQLVFQGLIEEAEANGSKVVVANTANSGVGKVLQRVGFTPSDLPVIRYFYGV
jgi:hypothetical protein